MCFIDCNFGAKWLSTLSNLDFGLCSENIICWRSVLNDKCFVAVTFVFAAVYQKVGHSDRNADQSQEALYEPIEAYSTAL